MTDRRRRQKEQRAAKREAEKKQEARKELGRRLGTAVIFGLVVAGIFAVGAILGRDRGDLPPAYQSFRDQPTACDAEQPDPERTMTFEQPEAQADLASAGRVTATMETSCGEVVIALDNERSPATVNSFVFLAREGFFDGQVFHRVYPGFRVFSGDPQANGTGGPGYEIADEFPSADFVYAPGVVAMDNVGKGTTGSRFFIVTGDAGATLNPTFNVLGTFTSGDDTLQRISEVEVAQNIPRETVYIESVSIEVTGS